MIHKDRLMHWFTRLLALGVIGCGGAICYSGVSFLSQSTQPFQENLRAIKGTIQELDITVVGLRNQSEAVNKYLEFLELSLAETKSNLEGIDNQAAEFINLAGTSSVKLLNEAADALTNASATLRGAANQLGAIPFDPAAEYRKSFYSLSSNFKTLSSDLKVTTKGIGVQSAEFKRIASGSIATAKLIVETTEPQINLFRKGPAERMPNVLEALTKQLSAHVKMIDASYDLLNKIGQPVIAVGVGFILLGLRGLLMHRSVASTTVPFN